MADQQPPVAIQQPPAPLRAPFPAPPPFYKHFTKQNVASLQRLRKEAAAATSTDDLSTSGLDVTALPPELRYLLPPPLPKTTTFSTFGATHDLSAPPPTLSDLQLERLYPPHPSVQLNPQQYLISLLRSMLTTYLGLVGSLAQNPELYEGYTKDLRELVANVHDLINQYRPHQARETLIRCLEERVEGLREEARRVRMGRERVREVLGEMGREGDDVEMEGMGRVGGRGHEGVSGGGVEERKERQRRAWEGIEGAVRREE